jgi:hypothetical protein
MEMRRPEREWKECQPLQREEVSPAPTWVHVLARKPKENIIFSFINRFGLEIREYGRRDLSR